MYIVYIKFDHPTISPDFASICPNSNSLGPFGHNMGAKSFHNHELPGQGQELEVEFPKFRDCLSWLVWS